MKTICKKWKLSFVLITLFTLVLNSFTAFADINHLMINTGSNALMTLELDDSDYMLMSPRSSLGTVTNTIESNDISIAIIMYDPNGNMVSASTHAYKQADGRFHVNFVCPEGYRIYYWNIELYSYQRPSPGTYLISYDYSSDFYWNLGSFRFWWKKDFANAGYLTGDIYPSINYSGGDLYLAPYTINMNNVGIMSLVHIPSNDDITHLAGSFAINFTRTDTDDSAPYVGGNTSNDADYQNDVSSSLSNLSSSVDEVSDEIGFVAAAIQNLQGAMEPHYNNVLTQLHHITEQLHAFYDQIYNNIHLKEYALWQDIKTAIENIDLEVNVNLDKLKTSIDNMSQAVQNKLQSVTDTITGGYNNSGMQEDNNELSGALNELDNAEQEVLDDVNGYIEGFEYPSFDGISSGIIGALSFFGGFLHSVFLGMGEFGLIITFSLTMIFVLIIVGYHRIRS